VTVSNTPSGSSLIVNVKGKKQGGRGQVIYKWEDL